jgi:hypothetical protein
MESSFAVGGNSSETGKVEVRSNQYQFIAIPIGCQKQKVFP